MLADKRPNRRPWLVALQFAVAGGLLFWVFSNKSLRIQMGEALSSANLSAVGAGILAAGIGIVANIWRWAIFLKIGGVRVPPLRLTAIFLIGMAFNLVGLGSLGGDAARALLLMRDHPERKAAVFMSIIADHFSAIIALAVSAGAFALTCYSWFRESTVGTAALTFTLTFFGIALLVLLSAVLAAYDRERKLLPKFIPGRNKIIAAAGHFVPFAIHWKQTLLASAISFVVLYGYFYSYYFAGVAYSAGISAADIFAIMPVVEGVTTIPISFSGLGVREGLFIEMLGVMAGTAPAIAVLISLTGFACTVFWSLVGAALIPFHRRQTVPDLGEMPPNPRKTSDHEKINKSEAFIIEKPEKPR